MFENAKGKTMVKLGASMILAEHANWKVYWKLQKFKGNYPHMTSEEIRKIEKPYEVLEFEGNCLLNGGINALIWPALTGDAPHPIDDTYGCMGVGDSTVAAAAAQTGLQAASNHLWVLLNAKPTTGTSQEFIAEATFADAQANWDWNEACVGEVPSGLPLDAADPTGGYAINRKVQSLGTKVSGSWTLTVTITMS